MKRLAFFKVYGPVDPQKEAERLKIMPPEYSCELHRRYQPFMFARNYDAFAECLRLFRIGFLEERARVMDARTPTARIAHELTGKELPSCRHCGYGGKVLPNGLCFRCSGEKAFKVILD